MGSLPKAKAGVGSAVNDTTRQTGGALGVAVHRQRLRRHLPPRDRGARRRCPRRPPTPMVHDSIGKAIGVLDKVPTDVAEVIHADATHAFLQSMHVVYPIAALVIVAAIGVTLKWLPARATVVATGDDAERAEAAVGLEDALPDVPDDGGRSRRPGRRARRSRLTRGAGSPAHLSDP